MLPDQAMLLPETSQSIIGSTYEDVRRTSRLLHLPARSLGESPSWARSGVADLVLRALHGLQTSDYLSENYLPMIPIRVVWIAELFLKVRPFLSAGVWISRRSLRDRLHHLHV